MIAAASGIKTDAVNKNPADAATQYTTPIQNAAGTPVAMLSPATR